MNQEVRFPGPLRVALVAMPWPLLNRPSIQLGALKAYLDRHGGDWLQVDLFHPYLSVARLLGPELYHWLCRQPWASEALYAPMLFPEREPQAAALVSDAARHAEGPVRLDYTSLRHQLESHLENWMAAVNWQAYQLVGFSVCFHQLFSSLVAARLLKQLSPSTRVVLGGSFCAPRISRSLLDTFSFLDFTVQGEGERPLLELCGFLSGRKENLPAAILGREKKPARDGSAFCQESELDDLPVPDYRAYFAELKTQFADEPFIPVLPIEFSRGCWWSKCSFCNLNLQWRGYRAKGPGRMQEEVLMLMQQFGSLDFAFTDNALPPAAARTFFRALADRGRDLRFFGEIRVRQSPEELEVYRRGGLHTIQAGIESLSSSLLKKMTKGVSVFDNIAALRHCLAAGILLEGNLITEFPGSTAEEVEETLRNLEFVLPFPPLAAACFFLGHGSPVAENPAGFSIRALTPHRQYARLFPSATLARLTLLISDYRGDRTRQRRLWAPVGRRLGEWKEFHNQRALKRLHRPALAFREGGDFLLIRQELPDRTLHHRLRGRSREIYLYCEPGRKVEELRRKFPGVPESSLRNFLEDLQAKRLVFAEADRYLSLAIREH